MRASPRMTSHTRSRVQLAHGWTGHKGSIDCQLSHLCLFASSPWPDTAINQAPSDPLNVPMLVSPVCLSLPIYDLRLAALKAMVL
eukprot:scaffold3072_cov116-Isochrysis_galbana.AAC.5